MPVDSQSVGYERLVPDMLLVRSAMANEGVLMENLDKLKGVLVAPMYADKSWSYIENGQHITKTNKATNENRRDAYWNRACLVPVTSRTINALEGMIWAEEPEVELPPALQDSEQTLRNVSQEVTRDLIAIGRCGVLTDMPSSTGTISEQMSAYPIYYKPEQIFFWREDGGKLLEVRLYEAYEKQIDEFDWEIEPQIKRLFLDEEGLYVMQIWRDNELYSEVMPIAGGRRMDWIPFRFGGADENSSKIMPVVMYQLARLNLAHFRLDADDRDNLHYHGQAMTVVKTGMSADEFLENNGGIVDTGASGVNIVGQGDDIDYRQIAATGAISAKMDSDMQNMIACGAQLVKGMNDNTTLGAREMEFSTSTSVLKKIARNQTEMMTAVVGDMCAFMGAQPVEYTMKPKFISESVDAQTLQVAMQYVMNLGFPIEFAIEAARKANLHDETNEDMRDMIDQQRDTTTSGMTLEQAQAQAVQEANEGE